MAETNQATTAKRQRPLKVWGGLIFRGGKQCRTVVAATSQAKAAEALGCTLSEIRGWWAETGNKKELEVALAKPGQVFIQATPNGGDYLPKVRIGGAWVDA
jgi:hypothetical protein